MKNHILVVAEEAAVRAAIARTLHVGGYSVELASQGKLARNQIRESKAVAAIVVPIACTKAALQLGRELAMIARKLVILVRSAEDQSAARRWVPEADVLVYPPDPARLFALISESALMESGSSEPQASTVRFSRWTLDLDGRALLNEQGQDVPLTRGEFMALSAFLQSPGRVLSREYLLRFVSGRNLEPDDRSVDVLIGRLRRKIEAKPTRPQLIVTVPGGGYKLAVDSKGLRWGPSLHQAKGDSIDPPHVAERRQVTIVTCQTAGLAGLASRIDPEDLQVVVGTVQGGFAELIARFRGTVVQSLGDSMVAYFGYPRAHEEDAANAVRASLELVRHFSQFEIMSDKRLSARIGLATGLVVVGDWGLGGGDRPSAIGEALIVARHLQAAAPSGGILIADVTRDLVGSHFECRPFSTVAMDECNSAPVWQVVAERPAVSRFEALRSPHLHDFVGRSEELERLLRFWSKADSGVGQVVVLTGEAGIGKSRLILEVERRVGVGSHAQLKFSGLPHQIGTPMSALFDEVQASAGITVGDSSSQKLQKLQKILEPHDIEMEGAPLLVEYFGLAVGAESNISNLSPQKRKALTFAALLKRIEDLAARDPVLAIWEDAQWIDPTSLEFLALLVERAAVWPLLVVVIGRPDFVRPWPDFSYVTALTMSRLSRSHSEALIENISERQPLSAHLKNQILARTDGVPLFIEELTKSVLKTDLQTAPLGGAEDSRDAPENMPGSLQALLLGQIDLVEEAKLIAQNGAAVGREFSNEFLRLITDRSDVEISTALDRLVASGLVFRRGQYPQASFIFKHALVREAAYSMMTRTKRQQLHARIAKALEDHFPEVVHLQPELIAHHCIEADLIIKAVGYLRAAARQALLRSGTSEALVHIKKAQHLLSGLPSTPQRSQLELDLDITLSRVFIELRSYTAPATQDAYSRARLRCENLNDQTWLPLIILGQWVGAWGVSDHRLASNYAQELHACADENGAPAVHAVAHMASGMTLTLLGRLAEAKQHLEQAIEIDRFALPSEQPFLFPDVCGRISSLTFLHDCLLLLGQAGLAEPLVKRAEAVTNETEARTPSQFYFQALAQNHTLRMHVFRRDARKVEELGSALLRLSREQDYPYFKGTSQIYIGWALAQKGEVMSGIESCRQGMSQLQSIGAKCWFPHYCALLAECHAMAAEFDRGCELIADALADTAKTGEIVWDAELHRLKGRLLILAGANATEVEACFLQAMAKARQQKAGLFELRAATSFAEWLIRSDQRKQAREVLLPVYNSFRKSGGGLELSQAKDLLDTLVGARSIFGH